MALFRFHRGGLSESLETTIIVKNVIELMNAIRKYHENWMPSNAENFGIIIGPYPDHDHNFDKRIGWYTQVVTTDISGRGVFLVIGFLSEPLE